MSGEFPHLFVPGTIGKVKIKNRLVMPSMGTGLANEDGTVSEALTTFYEIRAKGGAGLIITEFTMINRENGRHNKCQLGAYSDEHIPGLREMAKRIHKHGTKMFVQLCHPGCQTFCEPDGVPLLTPSGRESSAFRRPCRAMTVDEIHQIVADFAAAAARVKQAGMDGVEINAAHGYLLNEFLSPYTNKRDDEYGRDMIGRCRIVKEIIEAVREKVGPDFPIILRMTVAEFLITAGIKEQGLDLPDSIAILNYLIPSGVDAVSVSSGIYDTQNCAWEPISYPQGWRIYLAETVKQNVPVPVIGVSVIREAQYAESILKRGAVDFVGVARGQLADPEWGVKAETGRAAEIRRCISCLHCMESLYTKGRAECAINPRSHHEYEYGAITAPGKGQPVVVIGGGPAGMEAARILALRGFKPILFEKNGQLGGQLHLAVKPPYKGKIDWIASYYEERLKVLNVDIRLNTEATVELVKKEHPIGVFLATGSRPNMPESIVGIHGKNVYRAVDILRGKVRLFGKQVIVVGDGQTGIETAETLGTYENVVSIIGKGNRIGEKIYSQNRQDVMARLIQQHARLFPRKELIAINPQGITVQNTVSGDLSFMPTEAVVLALGVRPDTSIHQEILEAFPDAVLLGDAIHGGRIADAVHSAYLATCSFDEKPAPAAEPAPEPDAPAKDA